MSFQQHQVEGQVAPRRYASSSPASAYLAAHKDSLGQFSRFSREIVQQADRDIDFARFDNDGPDGRPNSGDDDGYVDALFILTSSMPDNFLLKSATGIADLGWEEAFITGDPGASGTPIRIAPKQGTIQQGRSLVEAVGTMCHEYGHVLGLPDLFNTRFLQHQESGGPENDSAGIGKWGLMGWGALGWHGDDGPAALSAWSRQQLGWAQVVEVTQESQAVQLAHVARYGQLVRIPLGPREYFLLENRRRSGNFYDRAIPAEGLLVWHVREARQVQYWGKTPPDIDSLKTIVDLECADGRFSDKGPPHGRQPDVESGGDNLDFWAHDAAYRVAHAGNMGDATDPFDGVAYTSFTPDTNPSALSLDGRLTAHIENIRFEDGVAHAEVKATPPQFDLLDFVLVDADENEVFDLDEPIKLQFVLVHTGGIKADDVRLRLRTDDAAVVLETSETAFGTLTAGGEKQSWTTRPMVFRFAVDLEGEHTATLHLDIYANGHWIDRHAFTASGIGVRQTVRSLAVVDSAGNGDGKLQAGEIFQLAIGLELNEPQLVRHFDMRLRPLVPSVQQLSAPTIGFREDMRPAISGLSPVFLLNADVEPGDRLPFELEIRNRAHRWRDTLEVAVGEGSDRTPPRLPALRPRTTAAGLQLVLPKGQVQDGSAIGDVQVQIYRAADTVLVKTVPLHLAHQVYIGQWANAEPGVYLVQGWAVDAAGNRGTSPLQTVSVGAGTETIQITTGRWEPLNLPTGDWLPGVGNLAISPVDPQVLYMRFEHMLWRSTDGGETWLQAGLLRGGMEILADPLDPLTVYTNADLKEDHFRLVKDAVRWLKSKDGGASWTLLDPDLDLVAADPYTALLFADRTGRLAQSYDGGLSWQNLKGMAVAQLMNGFGYYSGYRRFFAASPSVPPVVYEAGRADRVFQSLKINREDAEHTWIFGRSFESLALDFSAPEALYATAENALWRSVAGQDWQVVSEGLAHYTSHLNLATHPLEPHWIYAWNFKDLWHSTDAGLTWEQRPLPTQDLQWGGIHNLVLFFNPLDPSHFFLRLPEYRRKELWETRNAGRSWSQLALPDYNPPAGTLYFDPFNRLQVGSTGGAIFSSPVPRVYTAHADLQFWDWQEGSLNTGFSLEGLSFVDALYVDPHDARIVLAHIDQSFGRSTDGGATWEQIGGPSFGGARNAFAQIIADPLRPGIYYLANANTLRRSIDQGETWEAIDVSLPPFERTSFTLNPGRPETLYLGIGDRVWVSRDAGRNWGETGGLADKQGIILLGVHPLAPDRLYALAFQGVYVSEDEGKTWTHLFKHPIEIFGKKYRLRFDPDDPARMFLITGTQLWETRDGGLTWQSIGDDLGPTPWFHDVAVDPDDPLVLYAATPWGVFRLGQEAKTAVAEEANRPATFALGQNYPNPFNGRTLINYRLGEKSRVKLTLYNVAGQVVRQLVDRWQTSGEYSAAWDGRDDQGKRLGAGVYFYELKADAHSQVRRLVLLK